MCLHERSSEKPDTPKTRGPTRPDSVLRSILKQLAQNRMIRAKLGPFTRNEFGSGSKSDAAIPNMAQILLLSHESGSGQKCQSCSQYSELWQWIAGSHTREDLAIGCHSGQSPQPSHFPSSCLHDLHHMTLVEEVNTLAKSQHSTNNKQRNNDLSWWRRN